MDNPRQRIELELAFSVRLRQLTEAQKQAVLIRILAIRSEPPPVRDWRVINLTGGVQRL